MRIDLGDGKNVRAIAGTFGILMVLIVFLLIESGTLAKKKVQIGDSIVLFRITKADGRLYAVAEEQRSWSNGWRAQVLIGEVAEVGSEDLEIASGEGGKWVVLRVGKAAVEFNSASRSFRALSSGHSCR